MSLFSIIVGGIPIYHWIPVPVLMLAMMSDSDREFLQELYFQHRKTMYHVARKHFADKPEELEEAISTTLERMCRYVKKLQEVPSKGSLGMGSSFPGHVIPMCLKANKKTAMAFMAASE